MLFSVVSLDRYVPIPHWPPSNAPSTLPASYAYVYITPKPPWVQQFLLSQQSSILCSIHGDNQSTISDILLAIISWTSLFCHLITPSGNLSILVQKTNQLFLSFPGWVRPAECTQWMAWSRGEPDIIILFVMSADV